MGWLPDKFNRNPFIVWGFIVATTVIFVYLFGKHEILDIIKWGLGMTEAVVNGDGR